MASSAKRLASPAKPRKRRTRISELGRELKEISDKIAASSEKLLTREQLEKDLAERRGLRP